jgi:hypothetical protein
MQYTIKYKGKMQYYQIQEERAIYCWLLELHPIYCQKQGQHAIYCQIQGYKASNLLSDTRVSTIYLLSCNGSQIAIYGLYLSENMQFVVQYKQAIMTVE